MTIIILKLISKLHHFSFVLTRMSSLVILGVLLIIGSHFLKNEEEKSFIRDSGSGIIAFSISRWLSQQGKRRIVPETNKPVRNPTIKFKLPD